ncbi:MAG TPA: OmpH family outer membrane protein [Bacteroidia bacterium]|jgi:outer membrane protein|nr:OmpH family outer membrane protein [Bacteroidia bacterium]
MKQVSLIVNIILVAAVAVLFYLYSSLKKNVEALGMQTVTTLQTPATLNVNTGSLKDAKIAYLNIDSLDYNYEFILDNSKEMRAREASLQNQYSGMVAKFQADYQELQQAAQAGLRPQAELEKEKVRLEQMQYEIAAKEKQMQQLQEEVGKKQGEMLKKVSSFISTYNNGRYDYILAYTANVSSVLYAKPGLDLTKEILEGLNAEYRAAKKPGKK